jgi:hypothetical protein
MRRGGGLPDVRLQSAVVRWVQIGARWVHAARRSKQVPRRAGVLDREEEEADASAKIPEKGGGGENEGGLEVGVGDAVRAGGESKQRLRQKTRQAHRQYLEEGACRVATHTAAE